MMQLTIESPGLPTDDQLNNLIESKFEDLSKYFDRVVDCQVVLKKENDDRQKFFKVDARLTVPQKLLFATEKAETFEKAVQMVVDDLEHQLRRFKEEREEAR